MFPSVTRTFKFLARTPLVPQQSGPAAIELNSFSSATSAAGPSRPRAASRTFSAMSIASANGRGRGYSITGSRGYASKAGKKELYSDEAGGVGAGTDDIAHTDAAFNSDPNPKSASKGIEQESGKDFTTNSPANPAESNPPGKAGEDAKPLNTSRKEAGKQ